MCRVGSNETIGPRDCAVHSQVVGGSTSGDRKDGARTRSSGTTAHKNGTVGRDVGGRPRRPLQPTTVLVKIPQPPTSCECTRDCAWQRPWLVATTLTLFDNADKVLSVQPSANVREPRENRGRLRHCIGLQTPNRHWIVKTVWEGGSQDEIRSQDIHWMMLIRVWDGGHGFHFQTNFSANEKDEASLAVCTDEESSAFILGFRRVYEGLSVFSIPRLVSRI